MPKTRKQTLGNNLETMEEEGEVEDHLSLTNYSVPVPTPVVHTPIRRNAAIEMLFQEKQLTTNKSTTGTIAKNKQNMNTQDVQLVDVSGPTPTSQQTSSDIKDWVRKTMREAQIETSERQRSEMNELKRVMMQEMREVLTEITTSRNNAPGHNQGERPRESEYANQGGNTQGDAANPFSTDVWSNRNHMAQQPQPEIHRPRNTTPLDKWGLKYDGDNGKLNVDDFIFRVEQLQRWNHTTWDEVIRDFHQLLDKRAKDWFWMLVRMNGPPDWATLKSMLQQQYGNRMGDFEITRLLMERTQKNGETIDEFLHDVNKLRSQLKKQISEKEIVDMLKRNVKESIGKTLYPIQIYTVDHFRNEYLGLERAFPSMYNDRQESKRMRHFVHEVEDVVNDQPRPEPKPERRQRAEEEENEIIVCWNCRGRNHTYRECRKPRKIFCFKCGTPRVVTPNCPKCNQGNQVRGTANVSEPRSNPFRSNWRQENSAHRHQRN